MLPPSTALGAVSPTGPRPLRASSDGSEARHARGRPLVARARTWRFVSAHEVERIMRPVCRRRSAAPLSAYTDRSQLEGLAPSVISTRAPLRPRIDCEASSQRTSRPQTPVSRPRVIRRDMALSAVSAAARPSLGTRAAEPSARLDGRGRRERPDRFVKAPNVLNCARTDAA